jgi:F0F1-type ATP synthase assembly protein I
MAKVQVAPRNRVAITVFVVCTGAGAAASALSDHVAPVIVGVLIGMYFLFAIQVVQPWERVALMAGSLCWIARAGVFSHRAGNRGHQSNR